MGCTFLSVWHCWRASRPIRALLLATNRVSLKSTLATLLTYFYGLFEVSFSSGLLSLVVDIIAVTNHLFTEKNVIRSYHLRACAIWPVLTITHVCKLIICPNYQPSVLSTSSSFLTEQNKNCESIGTDPNAQHKAHVSYSLEVGRSTPSLTMISSLNLPKLDNVSPCLSTGRKMRQWHISIGYAPSLCRCVKLASN
jgi:hypothetical protein